MNKAVPIEKLRGAVFGEPLNPQYKEAETVVGECSKTEKLYIDALLYSSCLNFVCVIGFAPDYEQF